LKLEVSEQYGVNTFNTAFVQVDYTEPLAQDLKLIVGVQFTDQRAVGDMLLKNAPSRDWSTYSVRTRAAVVYGDLTLTLGASVTGARTQSRSRGAVRATSSWCRTPASGPTSRGPLSAWPTTSRSWSPRA
jgi:hypothetical protein